ncbi:BrxE family protein [Aliidiomarina sp. Khilg15.8]
MTQQLSKLIAELKLLVGYLGEKSQHNWWESNFLGTSSIAFLQHTFPRSTLLSQYHGVNEAALRVHDEYVGIGKNYHLFRLPVSIERNIAVAVQEWAEKDELLNNLKSKEAAQQRLAELSTQAEPQDGPISVGMFEDENLEDLMRNCAGLYLNGFQQGKKCLPFMRGTNEE